MEKMESSPKNKYNIPILAKGMEMIELIAQHPMGLTIQEIVNLLGHSKTSIYRIICSLEEMGYLYKDRQKSTFSLTRKMFKIGLSTLGTTTIIEHSYEPMRRLRDRLRETVVLGTLMETKIVILEQVIGSHHFSFILKSGMGVCLHASAPGKVFLANIENWERDEILSKIEFTKYTDRTITNKSDYLTELERVKACGYGLDMGEELSGIRCIGAPIFNMTGKIAASIWITGPAERLADRLMEEYGREVVAFADEISEKMGFIRDE
ncbi:MAG: IclR family transcriptional regulator [Prolixibacteraceae bacterium]